jgi:hypothetical protein
VRTRRPSTKRPRARSSDSLKPEQSGGTDEAGLDFSDDERLQRFESLVAQAVEGLDKEVN